ncbi:MAG: hypothetical protein JWP63_1351, partial [Candidatus Solibacter sp.]|nr:hypothetical protein [Candidatus Solibacter sp.]
MMNRRELLQSAGLAMAASQVLAQPRNSEAGTADWLKTCRALICEAYNPPFYPSFDYKAEMAVNIATTLGADSMRYPAASYFAYFPTKSGYPVHPELKG